MNKKHILLLLLLSVGFLLTNCHNGNAQNDSDNEKTNATMTNDKAYLFNSEASENGKEFNFSLSDALKSGPVVVYFFPSAYTNGCDIQAHTFATLIDEFKDAGASVVGVSADDIDRLNVFSADPDFCAGEFPIATDPDGKIAAKFGLQMTPPKPGAKDVRGEEITHGFIPRTTFVIAKNGNIEAELSSEKLGISPKEHVEQALAVVKKMDDENFSRGN